MLILQGNDEHVLVSLRASDINAECCGHSLKVHHRFAVQIHPWKLVM